MRMGINTLGKPEVKLSAWMHCAGLLFGIGWSVLVSQLKLQSRPRRLLPQAQLRTAGKKISVA